jgi:hypothetical protein
VGGREFVRVVSLNPRLVPSFLPFCPIPTNHPLRLPPPTENFALTEVSYTTIRLMQAFPRRLESRDPEPWREYITFIVGNLGGCKVGLFPSEEDDEK